jgi:hypothetical protein
MTKTEKLKSIIADLTIGFLISIPLAWIFLNFATDCGEYHLNNKLPTSPIYESGECTAMPWVEQFISIEEYNNAD